MLGIAEKSSKKNTAYGIYFVSDRYTANPVAFSQMDMALVQAAFIGSVVVFPNHFGAGSATKQELEGYLHLWRVVGYYLGVKDSCNLAKMETLEESRYVEQKKPLC